MNLCLDAGYVGSQKLVEGMGYEAHIRGRREEKTEQEHNPLSVARRWVVEVYYLVKPDPAPPGLIPTRISS
jgi:hypothetical protein